MSARVGNDVFLDQHLDPIRRRLQETVRADAIRPVTILNSPENFPLEHRDQGEECGENKKEKRDVEQNRRDLPHPLRRAGEKVKEPMLGDDENLVDELAAHCGEGKRATLA